MERGDVRWYTFRPPDKRRPVLVLTRSEAIDYLDNIVVASITSTIRGIPSEVIVDVADGMPSRSAINLANIATVSRLRLSGENAFITKLDEDALKAVRESLLFAFDIACEAYGLAVIAPVTVRV